MTKTEIRKLKVGSKYTYDHPFWGYRETRVVKNVLTNDYGISEDRISVDTRIDATDNVETSRSAILTLSVE